MDARTKICPLQRDLDRDVTERYDPEEFAERSFALHALQTRFSETSVEKRSMSSVYVYACLPKHNSCFIVACFVLIYVRLYGAIRNIL